LVEDLIMKKFRTGLVVGKFSPLHYGHEYLLNTAIDQCEDVVVISYSKPEFRHCEYKNRQMWFDERYPKDKFPNVRVLVIDPNAWFEIAPGFEYEVPGNRDPELNHRDFCATILLHHLHTSVDAVFSSEEYGDGFAKYLTDYFHGELGSNRIVEHVNVDQNRQFMPISGTAIRRQKEFLHTYTAAPVRSSFVKRLVLLGGESSGKTTLATALGEKFYQEPVWEYGRELTEWLGGTDRLRYEDLEHIAEEQVVRERRACGGARLDVPTICDTSPLTTMFYSEQMFGHVSPRLQELAKREYEYTILCAPTIPFEDDGTRFDSTFRDLGHAWYVRMLSAYNIPYLLVDGTVQERLAQVLNYIGVK
jgi:HTH-type transcriptional repressor of NAD biosynthesis genes